MTEYWKCDKCGKSFEHYFRPPFITAVRNRNAEINSLSEYGTTGVLQDHYDFCKECWLEKIMGYERYLMG
jgi:hypothetical protein